jgi:cobalt-precorrin 5A hydrolase
MGGAKAVIVAGIGCRPNCPAEPIVALVRRALQTARCEAQHLAIPALRASEPGVRIAAARLHLPLMILQMDALAEVQGRCVTRSRWAKAATGLAAIAEAAALAAAGPGSTLLLPRISNAMATCALAGAAA